MPRILGDKLKVLRRLYGPPGQLQSPQDIEYNHPIQVVHDISREAELGGIDPLFGSGTPGSSAFFNIVLDNVEVGVATTAQEFGVYSNQDTGWALAGFVPLDPETETGWVLGVSFQGTAAGLGTGMYVSVNQAPKAGAGSGLTPMSMVAFANAPTFSGGAGNLSPYISSGATHGGNQPLPVPFSNKLLNNPAGLFVSHVSGADTIDCNIWCVRLPNGVMPPGLR